MYKVKNFKTAREFVNFNEDFIYKNPMQNALLINVIEELAKGNISVFQAFNLVGNKNIQLLVLIVDEHCLIYCNKYDHGYLIMLSKELPFERIKDFVFAGDKDTIENLLHINSFLFKVEKYLITYKCEELNTKFKIAEGGIRSAKPSDVNILSKLSVDFTEEYDGNKKSLADMRMPVHSEMMSRALFVWEHNDIYAMAVEMNRQEFDYPEIGKLFTVAEQRGKGYSSSLLFKLTEKILLKHTFCMLYTDGNNTASNLACNKVGYTPVANYIRCRIHD